MPVILSSKLAANYNQKSIEAMRQVAKAAKDRSLGDFLNVSQKFKNLSIISAFLVNFRVFFSWEKSIKMNYLVI